MLLGFFCSQWALYFYVAWMPVYLQQGRHLSENEMKTVTSFLFLFGMAGAILSGILNDFLVRKKGLNFGRRFVGFMAMSVAGLCLSIVASTSNNSLLVICLPLSYFFYSFFAITAFSTCVDVGGAKAGTMAGIMNFAGQTGAFFLSISFGKIVDAVHNYNTPVMLIAVVVAIGSIAWLGINPSRKIELLLTKTG
jgi:sugar phosphate permease